MDAALWERVKTLFHDALTVAPSEREAWLRARCDGEPVIADELRALLAAHDDAARAESDHTAPQVGRYRILSQLGVGGFGTVYLAEQLEPVHRRVALKVLRAGMDSAQVIQRFQREREAVARMSHPNIAQIYDAGTTDAGLPFFAMEFVDGLPLVTFCDRQRLPLTERLRLLVQVCHGVHHAHQKGVIHRDLKPSNVLVAIVDGAPLPKIIDFGIAKATLGEGGEDGDARTVEARCLGTPGYMSPEQADLDGTHIDVRSDVYSLGVLLYELLTGRLPHDPGQLPERGLLGYLQRVREVEPRRPSTTVTRADSATAATRGITSLALRRRLRGDLDWITLRALERDPTRRYQSADDIAEDIERHLRHEPVLAGPPGLRYRLAKFVRRHRVVAASSAAIVLALVGGLAAALWQNGVARAALTEAIGHRLSAQAINLVAESPTLALLLAIEGASRAPGEDANTALYATLGTYHEFVDENLHDAPAGWLAKSRNGGRMLTGDESQLVISWDLPARALRHRYDEHAATLTALALSDDGRFGCSADAAGLALLLDLDRGVILHRLEHPGAVNGVAFVPDRDELLTICSDGQLRRFDAQGAAQVVIAGPSALEGLGVDSRGQLVAVLDAEDLLVVQDLQTGREVVRRQLPITSPAPGAVYLNHLRVSLQFSDDGRWLASLSRNGRVDVIDLERPDASWQPTQHHCNTLALAADAGILFVGEFEVSRAGLVFDLATRQRLCEIINPDKHQIRAAAMDRDGQTLITAREAGASLYLWEPRSGRPLGHLSGDPHRLHGASLSRDGTTIDAVGHNGALYHWRAVVFEERRRLCRLRLSGEILSMRPVPPGDLALCVRAIEPRRFSYELRDTTTAARVRPLATLTSPEPSCGLTPRGDVAILGADDRTLIVRLADGAILQHLATPLHRARANVAATHVGGLSKDRVVLIELAGEKVVFDRALPGAQFVDVNHDGTQVLVADGTGNTATLWSVATGQPIGVVEHRGFVFDAMFSADGTHIVTFANDATTRVTRVDGMQQVMRQRSPTTQYGWLCTDAAGRYFAVHTVEEVAVYQLHDFARVGRWRTEDPRDRVAQLQFQPDGSHLLMHFADGRQRNVPMDPLAAAIRLAPRALTPSERSSYGLPPAPGTPAPPEPSSAKLLIDGALAAVTQRDLPRALRLLDLAAGTRARMPLRFPLARAFALSLRAEIDGGLSEADRQQALTQVQTWLQGPQGSARLLETLPELAALRREPGFAELLNRHRR